MYVMSTEHVTAQASKTSGSWGSTHAAANIIMSVNLSSEGGRGSLLSLPLSSSLPFYIKATKKTFESPIILMSSQTPGSNGQDGGRGGWRERRLSPSWASRGRGQLILGQNHTLLWSVKCDTLNQTHSVSLWLWLWLKLLWGKPPEIKKRSHVMHWTPMNPSYTAQLGSSITQPAACFWTVELRVQTIITSKM